MVAALGVVNAETPYVLLATEAAVSEWSGAVGGDLMASVPQLQASGRPYEVIRRHGHPYLLWFIEDPGTAEVFATDDGCLLVRVWPGAVDDAEFAAQLAARADRTPSVPDAFLEPGGDKWVFCWAELSGADMPTREPRLPARISRSRAWAGRRSSCDARRPGPPSPEAGSTIRATWRPT